MDRLHVDFTAYGLAVYADGLSRRLKSVLMDGAASAHGYTCADEGIAHALEAALVLTTHRLKDEWREDIRESLSRRFPDDPLKRWCEGPDYTACGGALIYAVHPFSSRAGDIEEVSRGYPPSGLEGVWSCVSALVALQEAGYDYTYVLKEAASRWPTWEYTLQEAKKGNPVYLTLWGGPDIVEGLNAASTENVEGSSVQADEAL